jgi:LysR family glycine cleavage system transcriptional activator
MISATPAFAAKWLVPRIASLQKMHPHIDLHVHASNTPVDLRRRTVDIALRYGLGKYPGCISALLVQDWLAPVASPSLRLRRPHDVQAHRLIHFDWQKNLPVDLTWAAWMRAAGQHLVSADHGVHYSDESHAIQAAVAGQGVALLSLVLVQQELKLGLLEAPIAPRLEGLAYHIVRPADVPASGAVAAIESWLLHEARQSNTATRVDRPPVRVPHRERRS